MGDEDLYLIATNEVDEGQQDAALWAKALALCEGDNSTAKYKYIALRVEMLGTETLSATSVEAHNKPADSEDMSEPKQDQLEFVRAQVYAAINNTPINEVFSDLANGRLTGEKRGNIWYVLTKGYSPDVSVNKEAKTTSGNSEETTSLDSPKAPKVSCPRCYAFVPSDQPTCSSCGKPLPLLRVTHRDGTKAPKVSCPRCYAFVPSDQPTCSSCGKPLPLLTEYDMPDLPDDNNSNVSHQTRSKAVPKPVKTQSVYVSASAYAAQNNIPIKDVLSDLFNGKLVGQKRGNYWYVLTEQEVSDESLEEMTNEQTTGKNICPKCSNAIPIGEKGCPACERAIDASGTGKIIVKQKGKTGNYFVRHWRGELPLSVSFWLNVVLVNIGLRIFDTWLTNTSSIENPVVASQVTIGFLFVVLVLVYPWQIIGLWRSANRHREATKKSLWSGVVKGFVLLGLLGTLGNLGNSLPIYKYAYQIGFGTDEFGDYRVELTDDNQLIHLKGGLGFGIAKEVEQFVAKNPNVKGIILDSRGGWVYEGRALSKIIFINGLDTYSLKGCYSACGTAYISGNKRYLAKGANLAFHQYRTGANPFESYLDLPSEQKKDLLIFERQGVSQEFINRLFKTKSDDLWYPTVDEMLISGVVNEVVDPSTLRAIKYDSLNISEVEEALKDYLAFQVIEKYEPKTYQQITKGLEAQMEKGASILEIQQGVASLMEPIAGKALPKTSNKALIKFVEETTSLLRKLEEKNPIFCLKNLFPEQYGPLEMTKYLSNEEMTPMLDALSLVIIDSYNPNNAKIDVEAAERLMAQIVGQLGDDANYLEAKGLQNKEEYSRACNAIISFYNTIISNSDEVAGNGLRYVFSSP